MAEHAAFANNVNCASLIFIAHGLNWKAGNAWLLNNVQLAHESKRKPQSKLEAYVGFRDNTNTKSVECMIVSDQGS